MRRIIGVSGRGGVDWRSLDCGPEFIPNGAVPVLVVYLNPNGTCGLSCRPDFAEVMTTEHADAFADSVRQFLTGMVRPKG